MAEKGLRVVFMGTPDFAVPALENLIRGRHQVVCVYTQPPRPKGRGQEVQPSPVHLVADAAGIPVRTPHSLKKDLQAQADFAALHADVAVVAAYGLILPQAVLDAPRFGCLNIHASLLPRWRGASPIQHAVWAGDAESGVTIMQMEAGLDTGPMISKAAVPIRPETTAGSLHDALSALGSALIEDVLDQLADAGRLDVVPQDDSLSIYAPMLTRAHGALDWTKPADALDRQVRALNPWPGTWTTTARGVVKVLEAVPEDARAPEDALPGTLLDREGRVACAGGSVLRLVRVQPPNGRAMDVAAAVNGRHLIPGEAFAPCI